MKILKIKSSLNPQLVKIHSDGMYEESAKTLMASKNMLENFANHNNVKIDIYAGQHAMEEGANPSLAQKYFNKLQVVVEDLKSKKDAFRLVLGHPEVNEKSIAFRSSMVYDHQEGLQRMCNVKSTSEDGLLRRVYRVVDFLTEAVKNK